MSLSRLLALLLLGSSCDLPAQLDNLDLPARPPAARTGGQVKDAVLNLAAEAREEFLYREVVVGNVPGFLRNLVAVRSTDQIDSASRTAIYYVTPDYLAVGSEQDYFRMPMPPTLAQRIADSAGCILPTRKMVDQIYQAATVKLGPAPIPPSPDMVTVPVFWQHEQIVRQQLSQKNWTAGALVAGHKKDIILSVSTSTRPPPPRVCIYGWHRLDGTPIQPLSTVHKHTYADYSHGTRLVSSTMLLDGATTSVSSVLMSKTLHPLLSDEGPFSSKPKYPTPSGN